MTTWFTFGANVGQSLNQQFQVSNSTATTASLTSDVQIYINEATFQNKKEVLKVIEVLERYLLNGPNLAGQKPIQV